MILRSALAFGVLTGALFAFVDGSAAQNYPPTYRADGTRAYPARPVPSAAIPDDDDDIPPSQRADPRSAPPPPGSHGPYAYGSPPQQGQGVESEALPPAQGQPAPYYGSRPPTVIYGDRNGYQAAPAASPYGHGQPESYGSAPQPGYPPTPAAVQPAPYGGQPQNDAYAPAPMPLGPGQTAQPPREVTGTVRPNTVATLPPDEQPDEGKPELPPQFRRQLVNFQTTEPAGTIVIDTANTFLYLVLGNGQAMRYGIGVGREGFTWAGAERISRMKEWPDWYPPAEMIERQPYLPRMMAGGETNPLGARALYLGKTLYRIHGTNQPSTIGKYVSSGCIRLTNDDIADLYTRVQVGTRVVVLAGNPPATAQNTAAPQQQPPVQR
jgi:lipoprotein-anchoring transpeptidase ErfK/SrfK